MRRRLTIALVCLGTLALLRWVQNRRGAERMMGRFLGVPYDLRWPTPDVLRERFWNQEDPRIFTPHVLGWGWSVNLYALGRRLGFFV